MKISRKHSKNISSADKAIEHERLLGDTLEDLLENRYSNICYIFLSIDKYSSVDIYATWHLNYYISMFMKFLFMLLNYQLLLEAG